MSPQWQWGPFILTAYSLSFSAAVVAAVLLTYAEGRRRLLSQQRLIDFILLALVSGIAGGRLVYTFFFQRSYYLDNPLRLLYIHEGGLSFWGGLLAATAVVSLWALGKKIVLQRYLDSAAPGLALALVLGLIGHPLRGKPMAAAYPWGIPADAAVVHPEGAYAAVLLTLLLAAIRRRRLRARYDGELFMWVLAGSALVNLAADHFRAVEPLRWGLSAGQLCAAAIFFLSLLHMLISPKSYIFPYRTSGGCPPRPPSRGRKILANLALIAFIFGLTALYYYLHGLPLFLVPEL